MFSTFSSCRAPCVSTASHEENTQSSTPLSGSELLLLEEAVEGCRVDWLEPREFSIISLMSFLQHKVINLNISSSVRVPDPSIY
jgi:hypothetical protein